MPASSQQVVRTDFVINDQVKGYPTRTVTTTTSCDDMAALVSRGFLIRRGLLPIAETKVLAESVLRLARLEEGLPESECISGQSIYIRELLDKDEAFHSLLRLEPILSMARTLIGPQVWIDLEARMNYSGIAGVAVPWHNHMPVIPDPVPVFFCFPHQLHCLIYLDRITATEGALCLLPGSHMDPRTRIPLGDQSDRDDQVELYFEPGDAVIIHGNLWHRTQPSLLEAGFRRLLLLGYVPSWVRNDIGLAGVRASEPLRPGLLAKGDPEVRELLGEFSW